MTSVGRLARKRPIGAECVVAGGVDFRVWAPKRARVDVVIEDSAGAGAAHSLEPEPDGYFRGHVADARDGTLYRFRLDGDQKLYPDPASRAQPDGPHGPSRVVDPSRFEWTDSAWRGPAESGHVIYEMHVGTFTREGTWAAAAAQLTELASLGVTMIEMMPVAEFPGRFGWGYDGVDLFAPTHLYGTPDDLRTFVDRAHAAGMSVILDVVYNHLGPDGNYLSQFADHYFTDHHETDWGAAINYDDVGAASVRELMLTNAAYWIEEFHFDGLRLDATQNIYDDSRDHVVAQLARTVRASAAPRTSFVVGENEPQDSRLLRPVEQGGYAIDALWNDDFHHTARVALTGRAEAYYEDYGGTPQEILSALKRGFLYQGQRYAWQKQRRGTPSLDLPPTRFVIFLENHDQVANTAYGDRLHRIASPGRHRALTTVMLLAPSIPMLFQGQEFASSSPFLYFADHVPELASKVRAGRHEFLAQFPSIASPDVLALVAPPDELATFERCKLDFAERTTHAKAYAFHRELLSLRKHDPVLGQARTAFDGAVLTPESLVLRFFGADGDDRLIVMNLGRDVTLSRVPEPLLAPPARRRWEVLFSSDDPRYGGAGTTPVEKDGSWRLLGHSTVVFRALTEKTL